MPLKLISQLMKPRHLRSLIFALIVFTAILALYQLFLGNPSRPIPTQFGPLEVQGLDAGSIFIPNGEQLPPDPENEVEIMTPSHGTISESQFPRYTVDILNSSTKYENDRKAGKCLKVQSFKPDFDALEVYPNLEFDAEWIRGREYWNKFFEQRYKKVKSSKNSESLKVFVIPHSHNDPGWLKTFEEYYTLQTKHVLDNLVKKLTEFKDMSFLWSEISFLSKWWKDAHPRKRVMMRNLVQEGRLEIVTGGWVMTDEATVNLYSMIDQLIEGHQWVKNHFNVTPKSSWSVDPFGHGSVFPYILRKSGVNAMVIQRIHYSWKKWLSEQQKSDFEWVQRWDYAKKHSILCHNAPFDIYSIKHSCGPHPQICLNFDFKSIPGEYSENSNIMEPITASNQKEKSELMLEQYGRTASLFSHNVAMISMGDDFRFTKETEWDQQYNNYMKLFNYINSNQKLYNAQVQFGTIADYFKAVRERQSDFPTFSGDFHVYSDIFSEGRPAYWSGYYSTRPFWKKFFRETENNLRGAEILFSLASVLSHQNRNKTVSQVSQQVLNRSYEDLTTARRWVGLFAHHDASTGTSKSHTMEDYGIKLLEAFRKTTNIQISAIDIILFGLAGTTNLATDYELESFGDLPKQIPLQLDSKSASKSIVVYNNLAKTRYHLVKVVVGTPDVVVIGPDGQPVTAQLNPILDMTEETNMMLSSTDFELTFLAQLSPLSLSVYEVKASTPSNSQNAVKAVVYCKQCESSSNIFEVNAVQAGDIQLNNEKVQVLFDRNTGLLMSVTKIKESISVEANMKFGSYSSVYFRSGAYLLMPDTQSEQQIPFPGEKAKIVIVSGPISSEICVFHPPLILNTRIMHMGDKPMMEAIFVQSQIDLGQHNGEVYMRFDTDLNSSTKSKAKNDASADEGNSHQSSQPTFYTDQSGFTVEKRVKIPAIKYEGNTYPVNTMTYIEDEAKKIRFSVLVDRSHGFTSMEIGRLETLIERRTAYDDSRGMGEGVIDNRATISNYILLIENIAGYDKVRHMEGNYRASMPTLPSYHLGQELSYPAFFYVVKDEAQSALKNSKVFGDIKILPLINQELPCDSILLNLRTMTDYDFNEDLNFPSKRILLVMQKLGYLCNDPDEKAGCGNPNPLSLFYPDTKFNGFQYKSLISTDLAGVSFQSKRNLKYLHNIVAEPFEIASVVLSF